MLVFSNFPVMKGKEGKWEFPMPRYVWIANFALVTTIEIFPLLKAASCREARLSPYGSVGYDSTEFDTFRSKEGIGDRSIEFVRLLGVY